MRPIEYQIQAEKFKGSEIDTSFTPFNPQLRHMSLSLEQEVNKMQEKIEVPNQEAKNH